MIYQPMLALNVDIKDLYSVQMPMMVSRKHDGVRMHRRQGVQVSRTLKPIPNVHIQAMFDDADLEGMEGECMIYPKGSVTPLHLQEIIGIVMSKHTPLHNYYVRWMIFDCMNGYTKTFTARKRYEYFNARSGRHPDTSVIYQYMATSHLQVFDIFAQGAKAGWEGIVLKCPNAKYKCGRSTFDEAAMLKIIYAKEGIGKIIGMTQATENTNPSELDALGLKKKSSAQAGLIETDMMGALELLLPSGLKVKVGTGFTIPQREWFWKHRLTLKGEEVEFRYAQETMAGLPKRCSFKGMVS